MEDEAEGYGIDLTRLKATYEEAAIFTTTFNLGECDLESLGDLGQWIPECYDVYVVGLQEVSREGGRGGREGLVFGACLIVCARPSYASITNKPSEASKQNLISLSLPPSLPPLSASAWKSSKPPSTSTWADPRNTPSSNKQSGVNKPNSASTA